MSYGYSSAFSGYSGAGSVKKKYFGGGSGSSDFEKALKRAKKKKLLEEKKKKKKGGLVVKKKPSVKVIKSQKEKGKTWQTDSKKTFNIPGQTDVSKKDYDIYKGKGGTPTARTIASTEFVKKLESLKFSLGLGQGETMSPEDVKERLEWELKQENLTQEKLDDLEELRLYYTNATPEEKEMLEAQNPELVPLLLSLEGVGAVLEGKDVKIGEGVVGTGLGEREDVLAGTVPIGPVGPTGPAMLAKTSTKVKAVLGKIKKLTGVTGAIVGIGGISTVYGLLTSGKVKNLEGDITLLRTSTRDIVTSISKGGDPTEAVILLRQIEEDIRAMEGDLNTAIDRSPQHRLAGKDTQEFMFRNLLAVMTRRHAVQQFALDGDYDTLQRTIGAEVINS